MQPLQTLQRRWFPLDAYADPLTQFQAASTYTVAVALLLLMAIVVPLAHSVVEPDVQATGALINTAAVFLVAIPLSSFAAIWLTRRGRQSAAAVLLLGVWLKEREEKSKAAMAEVESVKEG